MTLRLSVIDKSGAVRASAAALEEAFLLYREAYKDGDVVVLDAAAGTFAVVALDDAMAPALLFLRDGRLALSVPFGPRAKAYSPRAFAGEMHRLQARRARPEELAARRDLAFNPYDDHTNATAFPHAFANVETRGEAVFAARNAIDGECANDDHGFWPYTSWGINRDPAAALTLDFGRPVRVDLLALTLRADFPHDAWWREANVAFDDGSQETLTLEKTGRAQTFAVRPRVARWLRLERLIKADDPSTFPALTRLQAFGRDIYE